jgi:hypothetical protein
VTVLFSPKTVNAISEYSCGKQEGEIVTSSGENNKPLAKKIWEKFTDHYI